MKACLWVREAGCGYAEVVEGVWPAAHVFHGTAALCTGRMRQHVLACRSAADSIVIHSA